jgi:hypothetical protein
LRAHGAAVANLGVEFNRSAQFEVLRLARRAGDRAIAHVYFECRLAEELLVGRPPGLADDFTAIGEDLIDDSAVHVSAIDVQHRDLEPLPFNVGIQRWGCLFLGPIGRRQGAGEDEIAVEIGGDVPLVSVETAALAFAPVTHLCVLDRDAAIGLAVAPRKNERPGPVNI